MNLRPLIRVAALATLATPAAFAAPDTTYCSLPGLVVATDATGDAGDPVFGAAPYPVPGSDVLDVYLAEVPNDSGTEKVYFTLTVDSAGQFLPGTSYQVKFTLKDGVQRFVQYTPYPTPSQLNPVTGVLIPNSDLEFAYGHNDVDPTTGNGTFSIDGAADAESSANPDGTITVVLSSKQIKQLKPGETLTNIYGVAQFNGAVVTSDVDQSDTPGVYELQGNDSCKGKSAEAKDTAVSDKSGTSFGGAFAPGWLVMMLGFAGIRRRVV